MVILAQKWAEFYMGSHPSVTRMRAASGGVRAALERKRLRLAILK